MGQQQLMLIVLGVIIVGIAVTVGINMFSSGAVEANRDQVISQVVNLASKAQMFYRKPLAMGGGDNAFAGFILSTSEKGAVGSNRYWLVLAAPAIDVAALGAEALPAALADPLFLVGLGTEIGKDDVNEVLVYATVTPTTVVTTIVN